MSEQLPPNPFPLNPIFNPLDWVFNDETLTIAEADKRYLKYPTAQGTENLQAINVNGIANFNNTLNANGIANFLNNITQTINNTFIQATATTNNNGNILRKTDIYGDLNLRRPTTENGGALRLWDVGAVSGNSFQLYQTGSVAEMINLTNSGRIYLTTKNSDGTLATNSIVANYNDITLTCVNTPTINSSLPSTSDDSTKIATTAWVQDVVATIPLPSSLLSSNNTWTGTNDFVNTGTGSLTSSAVQPVASDSSTKIPTTAWVQTAISAIPPPVFPSAITANSLVINSVQTPLASGNAGITNMFNSGGYASQFFSNVNYTYLNIWIDFQSFNEGQVASYNDNMMFQVDIVWDQNVSNTTPSNAYGQCSFLCKLFPKRVAGVPQWGSHFSGVTALTNNSYTGLTNYNSTNVSYAPFGRQYWCQNIQGSQVCSVYGGASYCLFQFPNPVGAGNFYCASTSIRCLDATAVQLNPITGANCGVKMYINFEA